MAQVIALLVTIGLLFSSFAAVEGSCSGSGADATFYPNYYQTAQSGEGTYYGVYTNGGHCTLDPTPFAGTNGIFATVAIADNIWDNSAVCGMCIEVTANGVGSGGSPLDGTYLVYVNNECPSCANSGIDFGLSGDGVWDISWKAVPCPVGSTNIQYLLQGANSYYIKLQARNTRYPVQSMAIQQGGTWRPLVRTADNFFTAGSTVTFPISTPITVQVVSSTGDAVTDTVPSITNGVVLNGGIGVQFPDCSSSSTTATSSTSATATTTSTTAATTSTTTSSTSTTGSTSTSTTGSGSSNNIPVYTDSVQSPFQDWSWATTYPLTTSPVYSGTYSYGFAATDYQAAYFYCSQCIDTTLHASIEFYINGGLSAITTGIKFDMLQGSGPTNIIGPDQVVTTYTVNPIPANTWVKGTVQLSNFPSGKYDGFWFQATTATAQPTVYLDSITVIGI